MTIAPWRMHYGRSLRPPMPEAVALRTAMSVKPTGPRLGLYVTLIRELKAAGIWSKLDALYLLAAHDAQAARINVRQPGSFDLSLVNAPTFATDQGYAGNGSTSYLNTGFNPATAGGHYALDSAHLGVWSRTASTANVVDIGARTSGTTAQSFLQARNLSNAFAARLNQDLSTGGPTVTDSLGHFVNARTGAEERAYYKNGTAAATSTAASSAVTVGNILIGALNNGGVPQLHSARQYAAAHIGGGLSDADVAALHAALLKFLTAVGAA